jgi:uncharacterized pyridoxal phosphate-containing UPF0001 family protein
MDALTRLVVGEPRTAAVEWHLIGPLQSNKTRLVAERFNWVHTVSSAKVARGSPSSAHRGRRRSTC